MPEEKVEKNYRKKKFRKPFSPPRMNFHLNPNEKYKAFKVEKAEGYNIDPKTLKKYPLVSYRNELYELNPETKIVERIDKVAIWEKYTVTVLPEESPLSSALSWIWDAKASEKLKEFYFKDNRKMIYYFLNDVKKAAKYSLKKVSFNKESFEKYKQNPSSDNVPSLIITLDKLDHKPEKDENGEYIIDDKFIDEIINLFVDTGLYDKEKDGKLIVAREVYFNK